MGNVTRPGVSERERRALLSHRTMRYSLGHQGVEGTGSGTCCVPKAREVPQGGRQESGALPLSCAGSRAARRPPC